MDPTLSASTGKALNNGTEALDRLVAEDLTYFLMYYCYLSFLFHYISKVKKKNEIRPTRVPVTVSFQIGSLH